MEENRFVLWFDEIGIGDVPSVGGKNASLGEMYRELSKRGVMVPYGFAITAHAYRYFLEKADIRHEIEETLKGLDTKTVENIRERGRRIRTAIVDAKLPDELEATIVAAYKNLCRRYSEDTDVAVRSSATAEDLPTASFAGQQETYLNIHGEAALLLACKRCFASLFTDRAISYRVDKGFDHMKIALSIGVQKMVRSDLASSGVMFSIDTETGFRDAVLINASYGLGENIVQGTVNPDEYYVFKPTLKTGFRPILQKKLGSKEFKMVYDIGGGRLTTNVPVQPGERVRFAVSDDEILQLARWACDIEEHYSNKKGEYTPMDIEWAKDGITGEIFIVQARPETVQSQKRPDILEIYHLDKKGKLLATGKSVGEKIAAGKANVIKDANELGRFREGEILVTDKTDPDWEPIMKKAAAIITNRGGRTAHAAIVSRELGIPAIVGTSTGTEAIRTGDEITVSCAEGDTGFVYEGMLPFHVERTELGGLGKPRTKIMMNVANPEEAFGLSFIPNDGVGLARLEFIINNYIKIHPMALLKFDQLKDQAARKEIEALTAGYQDKTLFFVDRLAQGVAMIGAAFYPRDVIVRLSDFKSNEYANLIGGREFEPMEENPMIGFRGASRYYDEKYREGFALECHAMKRVRDGMGLTNVKLMVPFCRTPEEGEKVLAEMERNGIKRGENGLEVYVMCEIPSNVILADRFSEVFDGFSIGSNDLTQLTLGVDRDSELVAHIFDERNQAVKDMVSSVIKAAKKNRRKIGICGQAPSDYPEFAAFLVREGIDSISLNPDAVVKTTMSVLELEKKMG